jgi:hypothetical protein
MCVQLPASEFALWQLEALLALAVGLALQLPGAQRPVRPPLRLSSIMVHLAAQYLRTTSTLLLLNDCCGRPIAVEGLWQ